MIFTLISVVERDIFAQLQWNPREWNLDSVKSHGTVGNGFNVDGNRRERFAICAGGARMVRIRRLSIRTRNVHSV